jgi:hypothetical protein
MEDGKRLSLIRRNNVATVGPVSWLARPPPSRPAGFSLQIQLESQFNLKTLRAARYPREETPPRATGRKFLRGIGNPTTQEVS